MNGHLYVCWVVSERDESSSICVLGNIDFASVYDIIYWNLELFRHCGIVYLSFYVMHYNTNRQYIPISIYKQKLRQSELFRIKAIRILEYILGSYLCLTSNDLCYDWQAIWLAKETHRKLTQTSFTFVKYSVVHNISPGL